MTLFTLIAAVSPTPTTSTFGAATVNENLVTPGWLGFTAIFVVAAAVIFLAIDLVRRIRRLNYRAEIREKLEAEDAAKTPGD